MKRLIITCVFVLLIYNSVYSQAPTYNLTAKNFEVGCVANYGDALYFDVYLEHTGGGAFELAGTQLYFSFNRNVFTPGTTYPPTLNGGTSANTDTSQISYKIVGSDLPTAFQPRNNSLWTATSPTADIMRGAINTFPGAGFGTDIPVGFPGTKIARYRLWNKQGTFNNAQLDIAWRNPPIVAFATKIFAYVGTTGTDLTTPSAHFVEYSNPVLPGIIYCNPLIGSIDLINPLNNSINNSYNNSFIWKKYSNIVSYKLDISTDSNFNSFFYTDSTLIDTFKTIGGLMANTKYFWKVTGKDSLNNKKYSYIWNFTTAPGIVLNLKFIPEGLYTWIFNLINRRDSIRVFLRNNSPPYQIIDSIKTVLDSVTNSSGCVFKFASTGTYYIVVKHLNSLETWSKSGGQYLKIDSAVNYDFTTAASQAYGNNMKLRGSKYCAYAGDVDQDGFIDGNDMSRIDNDAHFFITGSNLPSDLNGDGIVDGIDFLIGDNNWQYITVKSPIQISNRGFIFRSLKLIEP